MPVSTPLNLKEFRIVTVSYFLPVTVVLEQQISATKETNNKKGTDSMAATGPPSKYHYRTQSDANRFPYSPKMPHVKSPPKRTLSPTREQPLKFHLEPSTQGNIGLHKAVDSISGIVKSKIWIGHAGCRSDTLTSEQKDSIAEKLLQDEHQCIPVFLSESEVSNHYNKFCKEILWPAMHYNLPEYLKDTNERDAWAFYVKVNEHFAQAIIENHEPKDIIWIHDYHLFLVPQMVREKLPEATIGFFLHIPFPSSEVFRCLPVRKEILTGLLGADLIGFQTYEFARHFLKTCTRILGYESTPKGLLLENNVVSVGIFPIGIDPVSLLAKRDTPEVAQMIKMLEEKYSDKKIIVARDKLDPIKGVRQKLYAYETFLNLYPEFQGKVVLVHVALSTTEHPELQRQVSDLVSRINSKFGSIEYTPVVYLHQDISFHHYLALLSIADACLITSLRDGMNLTSHEYVFCQERKHSPLILSEFAGTYGSFGAALRINPWNYKEVAEAIHEALIMSDEDKTKYHKELMKNVVSNTSAYWAESFLLEVLRISNNIQSKFAVTVPHLQYNYLLEAYRKVKQVIFLLNYDGTLVPYEKTPDVDISNAQLNELLQKLTSKDKNHVYVMSGRTKTALTRRLGHINGLGLSAENGAFIRCIGSNEWKGVVDSMDTTWQNKVIEIFEYYTERTPGAMIEKKDMSLVWHFRLADVNFGLWQARECQNHIADSLENVYPIHAVLNAKNIEVRPRSVSKSAIAHQVIAEVAEDEKLVVCIGNERADEEIFELFRNLQANNPTSNYISCSVGSKSTTADFFTTGVLEVLTILNRLADEK